MQPILLLGPPILLRKKLGPSGLRLTLFSQKHSGVRPTDC